MARRSIPIEERIAAQAAAEVEPTPSIGEGEKLDAGISWDDALALLKKYNEDEFHITHGETVANLMRYYAKKYDPENEEFWAIVGLLHDLDWEKWQDEVLHTVKTAELLKEAGVNMQVAHATVTISAAAQSSTASSSRIS